MRDGSDNMRSMVAILTVKYQKDPLRASKSFFRSYRMVRTIMIYHVDTRNKI